MNYIAGINLFFSIFSEYVPYIKLHKAHTGNIVVNYTMHIAVMAEKINIFENNFAKKRIKANFSPVTVIMKRI